MRRLLCFLGLCLLLANVQAGSLRLDRTVLSLSGNTPVAELTVRNIGTKPSLVQTQVFSWSQNNNENELTPSQDLLVSPPIVEIAPGSSQILRVGLLADADSQFEVPYRLIIQEVPLPDDEDDGVAVSVLLKISFPVFVKPKITAEPILTWQANRRSANEITVTLSNTGNAHVQVIDLDIETSEGAPIVQSESFLAYVLPGETRSWNFETTAPWSGSRVKVSAETRQGRVHADLELDGG